ncbi:MAG: vitamin K epoxide reductase family protein [Planctomycetaceae bacterium]
MSVKLFHPVSGHDLSLLGPAAVLPETAPVAAQAVPPACSSTLAWLCRGLCLTGLGISLYLAWSALQMQPVLGCGGGEVVDCGHVLNSEWSKVAGVPVSIPAVALYGCLLALLSFARRPAPAAFQRLLWTFLGCGFLTAGLAAVWFISIQVGVLRHICPWCMGAHACSLALAGIALFRAPLTTAVKQQVGAIAVLAAGFLAAIQLGTEPPEPVFIPAAEQPSEGGSDSEIFAPPGDAELFAPPTARQVPPSGPTNLLPMLGFVVPSFRSVLAGGFVTAGDEGADSAAANTDEAGTASEAPQAVAAPAARVVDISLGASRRPVQLNVNDWPLVGSPDAKCVFVELFDYTCSHCRANHAAITAAMSANGVDAAMIALPVPLNSNCNRFTSSNHAGACELSELAVAVWRCERKHFPTFHSWMMAAPRTPAAARGYADSLVGQQVLANALASGVPAQFISRHVALYDKAGRGSVPKLLFSDGLVESQVPASWLTKRLLTLQQASAATQVPAQAQSELQTQGTAAAGAGGRPVLQSGPFTGSRK